MDAGSWSTREKLAITSFVTRLGENEWVDADKFLEPFCEVGRPSDWLAATACAHQMKDFLEKSVPATHDDILQNLTDTRIAELEQLISKQHIDCTRMRDELDLIESGSLDHELDELFEKISSHTNKGEVDHLQGNANVDYDTKPRGCAPSDIPDDSALSRPTNERNYINNAHAASPCVMTHKSSECVIPKESPSKTNHTHQVSIETSTPPQSARDKSRNTSLPRAGKISEPGSRRPLDLKSALDINQRGLRYEDGANSSRQSIHSIGEDGGPDTSFTLRNSNIPMSESSLGNLIVADENIVQNEISSLAPPADGAVGNDSGCRNMEKTNVKTEVDCETAACKAWKKSTMILWNQIASHRYASIFMHPVTDEIAPNYSSTVYRAVDLSSIKRDIENGSLRSTSEFQRDLMLMFQNALMYNNFDHHVYKMASKMQSEVMDQVAQFLITQIMASRNCFSSASSCELIAEGATMCDGVISASTDALLSVLVTESRPKRVAAIDMRKKQL